jgi:hypothetical protein
MKLIEGGNFLKPPLFLADSIGDLKGSRNETLALLDPTFAQEYQSLDQQELPKGMAPYDQSIRVLILAVNHEAYKRVEEHLGLVLWDSTGVICARIPNSLDILARRIISGDFQYNVEHWKEKWTHRGVGLTARYSHYPRHLLEDHETSYKLDEVLNLPRKRKAEKKAVVRGYSLLGEPAV